MTTGCAARRDILGSVARPISDQGGWRELRRSSRAQLPLAATGNLLVRPARTRSRRFAIKAIAEKYAGAKLGGDLSGFWSGR